MVLDKRDKIITRVLQVLKTAEGKQGKNYNRYKKLLTEMSDKEFDVFMHKLKDKKEMLYLTTQNMTDNILMFDNLVKAAHLVKFKEEHLWITNKITGVRMKTPEKYLVMEVPVRVAQHYLMKKMSTPKDDKHVDLRTGQVTDKSRSLNLTQPEMLILAQRNMPQTLKELAKIRGGDIDAYSEFVRSANEVGSIDIEHMGDDSVARSALITRIYLKGMMVDSTFGEKQ